MGLASQANAFAIILDVAALRADADCRCQTIGNEMRSEVVAEAVSVRVALGEARNLFSSFKELKRNTVAV